MFRTRFSPADLVVLLSVLLLAVLLLLLPFLWQKDGAELLITSPDGTQTYPLSTDREITVLSGGHMLTVCIDSGKVHVMNSDCPDSICIRSGEISKSGQTIVCAPAKVRLLIRGKGGYTDVDFIAG